MNNENDIEPLTQEKLRELYHIHGASKADKLRKLLNQNVVMAISQNKTCVDEIIIDEIYDKGKSPTFEQLATHEEQEVLKDLKNNGFNFETWVETRQKCLMEDHFKIHLSHLYGLKNFSWVTPKNYWIHEE